MSIASERARSAQSGIKHNISLGALAASAMKQYDRDSDDLRIMNRTYNLGANAMFVINNSGAHIAIDLDFTTDKRFIVLSKTEFMIDSVIFYEFNVTNLSATTAIADGEVYLMPIVERQLSREPFARNLRRF